MNAEQNSRIEILAYQIWEEQGRPEGRHEENWAEAERRLRFESDEIPTLSDDPVASRGTLTLGDETEDTPSRANPQSSRQQSRPGQSTQAGSPEIDSKTTPPRRARQR